MQSGRFFSLGMIAINYHLWLGRLTPRLARSAGWGHNAGHMARNFHIVRLGQPSPSCLCVCSDIRGMATHSHKNPILIYYTGTLKTTANEKKTERNSLALFWTEIDDGWLHSSVVNAPNVREDKNNFGGRKICPDLAVRVKMTNRHCGPPFICPCNGDVSGEMWTDWVAVGNTVHGPANSCDYILRSALLGTNV